MDNMSINMDDSTNDRREPRRVISPAAMLERGAGLTLLRTAAIREPAGYSRTFSNGSVISARNCSVLSLYLGGRREYSFEGGGFILTPGDILYIPCGGEYAFRITEDEAGSGYDSMLVADFQLYISTGEPAVLGETPQILLSDAASPYKPRFTALQRTYMQPMSGLKAQSLFYELFTALLCDMRRRELDGSRFSPILPAIRRIEESPYENTGVEELARMCAVSVTGFRRLFTEYSGGIPPVEYRNRLRIDKAAELLSADGVTVEEAARLTGFRDASYFHRLYKKYRGTTPRGREG